MKKILSILCLVFLISCSNSDADQLAIKQLKFVKQDFEQEMETGESELKIRCADMPILESVYTDWTQLSTPIRHTIVPIEITASGPGNQMARLIRISQ